MTPDLSALTLDDWEELWHRNQSKVKRMSDIALGDIAKPPPLIHGLLLDQTLTMLSSEPFSGKTLLTLAIAIALDSGSPLFSHYQIRERKKILYIGQDAPSWDYAEQTRKLLRGYSLSPEALQKLDIDMMLNEGINFFDPKSLKLLQDWHEVSKFNVLILDTLASMHGGNENDTREMGILMAMLKEIRDKLRCCVIFTHHTAKPSQGVVRSENYSARGASVISGSIDFHLALKREGDLDRIKLRLPKGRGAERMDKLAYFDIVEDLTPSGEVAIRLVTPNPADTRTGGLLAALATGPKTRAELVSSMASRESALTPIQVGYTTDNSLTSLLRAGKVKKSARGVWELA